MGPIARRAVLYTGGGPRTRPGTLVAGLARLRPRTQIVEAPAAVASTAPPKAPGQPGTIARWAVLLRASADKLRGRRELFPDTFRSFLSGFGISAEIAQAFTSMCLRESRLLRVG